MNATNTNTIAIALVLMTALSVGTALPALADQHGQMDCDRGELGLNGGIEDPTGEQCTTIEGGQMSCEPPEGEAPNASRVVGGADEGTFRIEAEGTASIAAGGCFFEVVVDASQIRFNEGYTYGLLAPYGSASDAGADPCFADPGTSCTASASFRWEREAHGVTFDVPYQLYVNGILVDEGEVHYYDPPAFDHVNGGPLVLD